MGVQSFKKGKGGTLTLFDFKKKITLDSAQQEKSKIYKKNKKKNKKKKDKGPPLTFRNSFQ
jgi:hypothetical protein